MTVSGRESGTSSGIPLNDEGPNGGIERVRSGRPSRPRVQS